MPDKRSRFRGALLGLAVGDAMGYTVDSKSLAEIREDYGPNGLLGYDLVNGYADVTSYTQLAAFTANGLLLGLTRGRMRLAMAPMVRYIGIALKEWSRSQHYCQQEKNHCWLSNHPQLKRRCCMDTWILTTLSRDTLGTMEEPATANRTNPFKDVKKGAFYYEAVLWAVEAKVTSGISATSFAPGDPCTRGQVVTFLYRTLN